MAWTNQLLNRRLTFLWDVNNLNKQSEESIAQASMCLEVSFKLTRHDEWIWVYGRELEVKWNKNVAAGPHKAVK